MQTDDARPFREHLPGGMSEPMTARRGIDGVAKDEPGDAQRSDAPAPDDCCRAPDGSAGRTLLGDLHPGECGWVFLDGAVELTPSSARRTTSSPGSPTSASRAMTGQSTLRGSASLTSLLANGRLHASVTGRSPRDDWTVPVDYAKQAVKLVAPGGPPPRTRNELSTTAAADRGRRPHPGLRPPSLRRNARTARSSSVWS